MISQHQRCQIIQNCFRFTSESVTSFSKKELQNSQNRHQFMVTKVVSLHNDSKIDMESAVLLTLWLA